MANSHKDPANNNPLLLDLPVDNFYFEVLNSSNYIRKTKFEGKQRLMEDDKLKLQLCPYCGDQFMNARAYKSHIFREENVIKCNQAGCDFKTFKKAKLSRHMAICMSAKYTDINIKEEKIGLMQCQLCPAKIRNKKLHFEACHDQKLPFSCDACGGRSQTELGLAKHKTLFHTTRKHKCECGAEFAREKTLMGHIRRRCSFKRDMKSLMPFKCDDCNYRTRTSTAMRIHVVKEHNEKKFECECGLKLASSEVYSKHVRLRCKLNKNIGKTTKDLLLQCDKCPRKVLNIEEHHNNAHDEKLPFGCDACFWRSKTHRGILHHRTQMHRDKKFKCECGKAYLDKGSLNYHLRNSCPLRKYERVANENGNINLQIKCEYCEFLGRSEKAMKIHYSKDHNKNKHKCECGLAYAGKKALQKHLRTNCLLNPNYIDNLPYKCDHCSFKCSEKKTMFIHIGQHHNQNKIYQCECGIKYSRHYRLLAHLRKNCLLNENRENKILPANCPKPPKMDNEIMLPKDASTQQTSFLKAQTLGPTVLIENKPTTSIESTPGNSQGSSGTVLIGTSEVTNSSSENDGLQIIQPQVVE